MMTLKVNGENHSVDVPDNMPILWVLRDVLGKVGTKYGCGIGQCGACTVHMDGQPIRSCITPVSLAEGKSLTTVEGLEQLPEGRALQKAWIDHDVPQCGYCQSGQLMTACALLKDRPKPAATEIQSFMSQNLCRCATYLRIQQAVMDASKNLPGK